MLILIDLEKLFEAIIMGGILGLIIGSLIAFVIYLLDKRYNKN
jgi:capsular polysaccharide biosynthesis protein